MDIRAAIRFGLLLCCFLAAAAYSQTEAKPWEKFGISQSEWKLTLDNKISEEKLKSILSSGIIVGEYCKKPWIKLGIKESDWIEKRRAGMTSYDIELDIQTDRTSFKQDNKGMMKSETSAFGSPQTTEMTASFFLPGYEQQKHGQKIRGKIMSGVAICCLAGCFVGSVAEGRFEPVPLFFIVPDMFWSLLDFKATVRKKESE